MARRRADPRALAVGSRGPGDLLRIDLGFPLAAGGSRGRAERELLELLALGGGLPDRLVADVAATWARRLRTGHRDLEATRPLLHAALYGRILTALRAWLGEPALTIALTMTDVDDERPLRRTEDGMAVRLPFSWLPEVWARGLTFVFGRLCVAAESPDGLRWALRTVGADLGEPQRLTLELG